MDKAKQVEEVLNKLAKDVYDLANSGDEPAKKIVAAHGINLQPARFAKPTPSATP